MGHRAARPPLSVFGPTALATPANAVTVARVLLLPFLVWAMVARADRLALTVWVALALSDALDGVIARRQGTTRSGAYLDPLADKVVVLTALAVLVGQRRAPWLAVVLIGIREVGVSLWRSVAGRRGVSVPASPVAKVKTALQMLSVGLFMSSLRPAALLVLWAAVVVALVSGYDYARRTRQLWPPLGRP